MCYSCDRCVAMCLVRVFTILCFLGSVVRIFEGNDSQPTCLCVSFVDNDFDKTVAFTEMKREGIQVAMSRHGVMVLIVKIIQENIPEVT